MARTHGGKVHTKRYAQDQMRKRDCSLCFWPKVSRFWKDARIVDLARPLRPERTASPVERFSELEKGMPRISQNMLIQQLRRLE